MSNVTPAIVEHLQSIGIIIAADGSKIFDACRKECYKVVTPANQVVSREGYALPVMEDDVSALEDANTRSRQNSSSSVQFVDRIELVIAVNNILPMIGLAPIDVRRIARTVSYCQNILNETTQALAIKVFNLANVGSTIAEKQRDEQEIVIQLKTKFAQVTDKHSKVKIRSVLP